MSGEEQVDNLFSELAVQPGMIGDKEDDRQWVQSDCQECRAFWRLYTARGTLYSKFEMAKSPSCITDSRSIRHSPRNSGRRKVTDDKQQTGRVGI